MHPGTGHLVDTSEMKETEFAILHKAGYEKLPEELSRAANRKLNGKKEAYVSLTSNGKLSKWARKKRKKKNSIARASRKKNRK